MAAEKLSIETVFLRSFARNYVLDIAWTTPALVDLTHCSGGLSDVLHVFKTGRVTLTEKEDSDGVIWVVKGDVFEGGEMIVRLQVWCNEYRVRVLRILSLKGD